MPKIEGEILIRAPLADTWAYYFRSSGWPLWVDGFKAVESEAGYPEEGGKLVWRSTPAGRGTVSETVLVHEPRTFHRIEFEDPESSGRLSTHFEVAGEATRVSIELEYSLRRSGPLAWLTERAFIRGQMRGSVARTLSRLRLEVEELADQ